jgi:flagellum-specific ATP synthase
MKDIVAKEQLQFASRITEILSEYERAEDLINIGAYNPGSNKKIDYAISMMERVKTFLSQGVDESVTIEKTVDSMKLLFYA